MNTTSWTILSVFALIAAVVSGAGYTGTTNFCCYTTTGPTNCKPLVTQFKSFTVWNSVNLSTMRGKMDFKTVCCARQYILSQEKPGECVPQSEFEKYYIDYSSNHGQ